MLAHGVYLAPSQFEAGFVSTAHDENAIARTLDGARAAFVAVAEVVERTSVIVGRRSQSSRHRHAASCPASCAVLGSSLDGVNVCLFCTWILGHSSSLPRMQKSPSTSWAHTHRPSSSAAGRSQ